MSTDFYRQYLDELRALDGFVVGRSKRAGARIEPQDPDVRRLLEALAFFSARTKAAAAAELRGAIGRLTEGLLDDFVQPQPARAMLRVQATARLTRCSFRSAIKVYLVTSPSEIKCHEVSPNAPLPRSTPWLDRPPLDDPVVVGGLRASTGAGRLDCHGNVLPESGRLGAGLAATGGRHLPGLF